MHTVSREPVDKPISKFTVGDTVLALILREGRKWLHATIVKILGDNVYEVNIHDIDAIWKRHAHQLLSIPSPKISDPVSTETYNSTDDRSVPAGIPVTPEVPIQGDPDDFVPSIESSIVQRKSSRITETHR